MNGAPTPSQAAAVREQIALWRSRGIPAHEVGEAMGNHGNLGWEGIRRLMERWLVRRGGA